MDDSALIVIDVQARFLAKLPPDESRALNQRICWLIGVARWLRVPLVVTAEDIPNLGGVDPQIARALPADAQVHNKLIFGLAGDPVILGALEQTGRRTTILVGLETDVCVAQSALGLLERGYWVAAVADATGSPGTAHAFGIERMRDSGVIISSIKGLFYEWVRTVEGVQRFHAECFDALGAPEGVRL
ncbi:MAG: isochorismatase family protein [Roseiflexaceae bacterium]